MSDEIRRLEAALAAARDEVETHGGAWERANEGATQASLERSRHRQAARDTKWFGIVPTRESRRHERLAEEAHETRLRLQAEASRLAPASHTAHDRVRLAERDLAQARELADPEVAELEHEQRLEALAAQRVHDRVEVGDLSPEEAYHPEGGIRSTAHDRELEALDTDYAQAAAEARDDQLTVRDLDQSIDAGVRTHEEVYTPEGHIRAELLHADEPEQPQAPARELYPSEPPF